MGEQEPVIEQIKREASRRHDLNRRALRQELLAYAAHHRAGADVASVEDSSTAANDFIDKLPPDLKDDVLRWGLSELLQH